MNKVLCSLKDNLMIHYYKHFLPKSESDNLYKLFEKQMVYNSEIESMVKMHGRYIKIPRKQVAYGAPGTQYNFTGNTVEARSYDETDEISAEIKKLINKINLELGRQFNFVLINRYENGNQYIGAHSDDERDLKDNYAIAGFSLGAERDILFQAKTGSAKDITLNLEHGSLFVMYDQTNKNWKHSIPKDKSIRPRISLTFREMK